ncbi:MAG: glycosyltransferase family 1 protein, partial [Nitrospirota bacterium]
PENVPSWFARLFKQILHSIDIERDYIVCISEYTRSVFIDYTQRSPRRVFASPLAADNTFQPVADETLIKLCRASYGIPEGDYFVALAELQPRKNLARLIIAFAQFLDETKKNNVYLVLVGGPSSLKNNDIFRTIERFPHRIKDKYIFTGYVDEKYIAALYSGAMMFIYPSLYEGFGLPPLEAMQCGVPVITSNSTSLPEVVGKAGLLIDPLDINALSAAMCTLYEKKSLRSELRENGLERATHFSWAKCADDIVKIYETAVHQ